MRTRKQMVAIIMRLKEKGVLGKLLGRGTGAASAVGSFVRTKIGLFGREIPLAISPKVAKSSWGRKHFSAGALRSYLANAPREHIRMSSLKGIYVLDNHAFNRMLGGRVRRVMTPDEISRLRSSLKDPYGISAVMGEKAPAKKLVGLHQHGRIFINAEQIAKQAVIQKKTVPAYKFVRESGVTKILTRHVLLHEFGHHVDNPRMGLIPASKIAGVTTKSTSAESAFFEKLIGRPLARASNEQRVAALESFADLYAQYAQHPLLLKILNRAAYDAIAPFFRG